MLNKKRHRLQYFKQKEALCFHFRIVNNRIILDSSPVLNDSLDDFLRGHWIVRVRELEAASLFGFSVGVFARNAVRLNRRLTMADDIDFEVIHQVSRNNVWSSNHHFRHIL
jgi:hypothetical protein